MLKQVLLLFVFIGIILIVIALTLAMNKCPGQQIVYRYIPRTPQEELNEPIHVSDIFSTMFSQQSPWIGGRNDIDTRIHKKELLKYYISQT